MATKKKPTKKAAATAGAYDAMIKTTTKPLAPIGIDPDLPLVAGNTVSFVVAEPSSGATMYAYINDGRVASGLRPSRSDGKARIAKIIERPCTISVEFYADGSLYAQGAWTVD